MTNDLPEKVREKNAAYTWAASLLDSEIASEHEKAKRTIPDSYVFDALDYEMTRRGFQ